MLKVACGYPTFLPWMGFWHRIYSVDLVIWETGVIVSYGNKDHYHNRVKLNGAWLTLPLLKAHKHGPFNKVTFDPSSLKKISKTLKSSFGKRLPHYKIIHEMADYFEDHEYLFNGHLVNFNHGAMRHLNRLIEGTLPDMVTIPVTPSQEGSKTQRLITRIRRVVPYENIEYLTGRSGLTYLDIPLMIAHRIYPKVQVLPEGTPDETVLSMVARTANSAELMKNYGEWETLK